MAIKTDFVAGDEYTAVDHNDENTRMLNLMEMFRSDMSDGDYNPSSSENIDANNENIVVKNYDNFTIGSGVTVGFDNVPDSGLLFVCMVNGDLNIAGTLDMEGDGSAGAAETSYSRTSGAGSVVGLQGTKPFNDFGWDRRGTIGNVNWSATSGGRIAISGCGSPASPWRKGNSSSDAVNSQGTATGREPTEPADIYTLLRMAQMQFGYNLSCGCGGTRGPIHITIINQQSGTWEATAGASGRGGGSVIFIVNGDYTVTGTIDLNGTSAQSSTIDSTGTINSTNANAGMVAGGASGGSSGCGLAMVKGTITDGSASYNTNGGNGATGAVHALTTNYTMQVAETHGADGADGDFHTVKTS